MNKERAAKLATVMLICAALGLVVFRRNGGRLPSAPEADPQGAIYGMMEAARAGDTKAFLSRYTGQMQSVLKETVAEKGEAAFQNYLRSTNAEIKGLAVFEPKPVADGEVQVRVEYVYQNRNEAQTMYLEKRPDGWKIARVDDAESAQTLVPYGTPVR